MQAFITKGCFTNHGGKIIEGDDSWLVDGKGVHLEGMGHFCPKCKVVSKALATQRGFIQVEPYRVCRRVNILRDYPDDKIKIYP